VEHGMVDVVNKHKKTDMIDVVNKRCPEPGTQRQTQ
jgi:hypothetical protein